MIKYKHFLKMSLFDKAIFLRMRSSSGRQMSKNGEQSTNLKQVCGKILSQYKQAFTILKIFDRSTRILRPLFASIYTNIAFGSQERSEEKIIPDFYMVEFCLELGISKIVNPNKCPFWHVAHNFWVIFLVKVSCRCHQDFLIY